MKNNFPKITIAILSWNRFHYLKATLESARECIQYPNIEWIVSDNNSTEPGLREYIEGLEWIDHKIFMTQSHPEAMNEMVDLSSGKYILIWPEDVQFTVRGDWMKDIVEILEANDLVGSMCLDYMRKVTIDNVFKTGISVNRRKFADELFAFGLHFRRRKLLTSSRGYKVLTFGWKKSGICGSGIPSLTRTDIWKKLGPWRELGSREQVGLVDSSLGAEADMVNRFYQSKMPLQGAIPLIPVAADIITDPSGCKAKVRGKYRYGVYMPPVVGNYYYKITDLEDLQGYRGKFPLNFTDAVQPIGYSIPLDENGDRKKSDINTTVVYDLENLKQIKYPLQNQQRSK